MAIRMKPDGSMEFDTAQEAFDFWYLAQSQKAWPLPNYCYTDKALIARLPNATAMQILEAIGDGKVAKLAKALLRHGKLDTEDLSVFGNIPKSAIPAAIRSLRQFGGRFGLTGDAFVVCAAKVVNDGSPGSFYELTPKAKKILSEDQEAEKIKPDE